MKHENLIILILSIIPFFLITTRYSEDDGNTIVNLSTKFIIDPNQKLIQVIKNNLTLNYNIIDVTIESPQREMDGISSATVFECLS